MNRLLRKTVALACGALLATSAHALVTLSAWTNGAYPFQDVYYSPTTNLLWYSKSPSAHDPGDPNSYMYEWYYNATAYGALPWATNLVLGSGGVTLGDWRLPTVSYVANGNGGYALAGEIDAMLAEIGGHSKMGDYFQGIQTTGAWPSTVWTQTWVLDDPNPNVWAFDVSGDVYRPASTTLGWYQPYMTTFAVMPATGIVGGGGGGSSVPEPGILTLLGCGAAAVAFARRRTPPLQG
jgi:hypothetical protein